MTIQDFIPRLLSQDDYVTNAAAWVNAVSNPATTDLGDYFVAAAQGNIRLITDRLNFKAGSIAQLVSTVGASNIKARFVLLPLKDKPGQQRFSLVLFATDSFNTRLSAYYLAEPYWEASADTETLLKDAEAYLASQTDYSANGVLDPAVPVAFEGAVPDALAMSWVAKWYLAGLNVTFKGGKLGPEIVNGAYGFLRGYTFDLEDFLAPLRQIANFLVIDEPDTLIAVKLGLHEYYYANPNGDNIDTKTLGLIVQYPSQVYGSDENRSTSGLTDDDSLFYDMSSPCPPKC
jgi:hypothetical protein